MKIMRTIPPAAPPLGLSDILHGAAGLFAGKGYIRDFEDGLRKHFGVRHVFTVSSGKAALFIILKALATLRPGKGKVLIPAYTCFSVPSAVVKVGLKVALSDIDPATLDFDRRLLKDSIDKDTLCVVPNHLFGRPADIDAVKTLCRDKGVFVVEDAAQAMGGESKGRKLGTIGDVGFFSLGRGKTITCGSGGVILTDSDAIAGAIAQFYKSIERPGFSSSVKELLTTVVMKIFIRPGLYWFPSGLPSLRLGETIFYRDFAVTRLSGMKAGLLRNWGKRLEETNKVRRSTSGYFIRLLGLGPDGGGDLPYLRLPLLAGSEEQRDRIYSESRAKGLGISLMYPTPVSEIKEIREEFSGRKYPGASLTAKRLLTIPTHQYLTDGDRTAIVELLKRHLAERPAGAPPAGGEPRHEAYNYN